MIVSAPLLWMRLVAFVLVSGQSGTRLSGLGSMRPPSREGRLDSKETEVVATAKCSIGFVQGDRVVTGRLGFGRTARERSLNYVQLMVARGARTKRPRSVR